MDGSYSHNTCEFGVPSRPRPGVAVPVRLRGLRRGCGLRPDVPAAGGLSKDLSTSQRGGLELQAGCGGFLQGETR